jgi:hypothetical protein
MKHEVTNGTLPVMCRRKELNIGGSSVTVSEFTWSDTFEFLRMLSKHSSEIMDDQGRFSLRIDKITKLICGAQELTEFAIIHSSGLTQEAIRKLSFADGLELLDAALEINLNAEILGRAKKVGGRFTAAIGVKLGASKATASPTPPQPSTSSSVKDTASTT